MPAVIDANGVGTYDACDSEIQAENFFKLSGDGHKQEIDSAADDKSAGFGFAVGGLTTGSELHYPYLKNLDLSKNGQQALTLTLRVASGGSARAVVYAELKSTNNNAQVATAKCVVPPTKSWDDYVNVTCDVNMVGVKPTAPDDVGVVIKVSGDVHLDYFRFEGRALICQK